MNAKLLLALVLGLTALGPASTYAQEPFRYAAAITEFQRAVDAYAFQHRQVQRRLGEGADQAAMAAGLRAARPRAADGDFFTPMTSDAFRYRIASRLTAPGCTVKESSASSSEVPRVGGLMISTQALPSCLAYGLPRLPEELAYRKAGVVLLLVDTHANTVVDVLHAAFPAP